MVEKGFWTTNTVSIDSLNWPTGINSEILESARERIAFRKNLRDITLDQMFDEMGGLLQAPLVIRDLGVAVSTSSYFAFWAKMSQASDAMENENCRRILVEESHKLGGPHYLEDIKNLVNSLESDPTGLDAADNLVDMDKKRYSYSENHPSLKGLEKANNRYKEIYSSLIVAGLSN